VEVLGDRRVHLIFSDGAEREIDLSPLLWGPVFTEIRSDDEVFRAVSVDRELGTIVWPNGRGHRPGRPARRRHACSSANVRRVIA
jgi:Protein of unknown function (DUF2442)